MEYINYDKHRLIRSDFELLEQLIVALEQAGVNQLADLPNFFQKNQIKGLSDFVQFLKGPQASAELATAAEGLFDRIRANYSELPQTFPDHQAVGQYWANRLGNLKQEEFWALYVNNAAQIVAEKQISRGTLDRTMVHPRDVMRWALIYGAGGVFICHNHPSGRLTPSKADVNTSKQLMAAAQSMEIDLVDHFIVGKGRFLSMVEAGYLECL